MPRRDSTRCGGEEKQNITGKRVSCAGACRRLLWKCIPRPWGRSPSNSTGAVVSLSLSLCLISKRNYFLRLSRDQRRARGLHESSPVRVSFPIRLGKENGSSVSEFLFGYGWASFWRDEKEFTVGLFGQSKLSPMYKDVVKSTIFFLMRDIRAMRILWGFCFLYKSRVIFLGINIPTT